jgi:hypothetical protein
VPFLGQTAAATVDTARLAVPGRVVAALAASRRAGERLLPIVVVTAGGLALIAVVIGIGYSIAVSGELGTDLLVGLGFTAMTVFGYVQFVRVLGQAGWRGSPRAMARRAFYDSQRLFSGAHLFVQLGVTGAATAAVVSAGLGPIAFPGDPGFRLVGYNLSDGVIYRINPTDGALVALPQRNESTSVLAIAAVPGLRTLPNGAKVTPRTVVIILSNPRVPMARVFSIDWRRGDARDLGAIPRPRGTIVGLGLAGGFKLILIDSTGRLLRADITAGTLTPAGSINMPVDAASYDAARGRFLAITGSRLFTVDVDTLAVSDLGVVEDLAGADPCGIARVGNRIVVADRATSSLIAVNPGRLEAIGTIGPSPLGASVCGIVTLRL